MSSIFSLANKQDAANAIEDKQAIEERLNIKKLKAKHKVVSIQNRFLFVSIMFFFFVSFDSGIVHSEAKKEQ